MVTKANYNIGQASGKLRL